MTDPYDIAGEAIAKACGRTFDPVGDTEMYLYYRRAAERAISALRLTYEEQSFYDHAEPYSRGYERRLVGPWVPSTSEEPSND